MTRNFIMDRKTFILDLIIALPFLSEPNFATDRVLVNAGVGGNNSRDLLNRLDRDCLSHKPNLVILMAGTNDMNSAKHVPPNEFKQNVLTIIRRIKATGSNLLLLTTLPFFEPYLLQRHPKEFYEPEGPTGRWRSLNKMIKRIASETNSHLLDVGQIIEKIGKIGEDNDSLLQNEINSGKMDGVHPTPNGYRFIALAVSQYIRDNDLPTGRIVCFGDSITKGDGSVDKESYPAYLKKLLS
ncbi:Lysophospholipase L1 [Parapedobacter indicus]|uniref:Lysophospholipase L1 n=2 Tax=Parapedobacter indicus TaxID=1477437 RepID=A0A1I3QMS9_9SPHI|nr:lysophospholipase L1-like esterase [Parapedobacter indicus]SFJ34526.1 Lysophospholipase L1 [Parapedobacter indicus]